MKRLCALIGLLSVASVCYSQVLVTGTAKISGSASMTVTAAPSTGSPFIPSGQGWHDLGVATQLQVSAGVNESPALCSANSAFGSGYAFTTQCSNAFLAWSSAAWDDNDEVFWVFGGGHTDYNGNDVWKLKIGQATPALIQAVLPTVPVSSNSTSFGYIPDANQTSSTNCSSNSVVNGAQTCPNSRHTYGGLAYVPSTNVLMVEAGAVGPNGPLRAIDQWELNHTTLQWARIDNCGDGLVGQACFGQTRPGSSGETIDLSCMTYNPVDGFVYFMDGFDNTLWKENPSTHVWTKLASGFLPNGYGEYMSCSVDPVNNVLVTIQSNTSSEVILTASLASGSSFAVTDQTSHCSLASSLYNANGSSSAITYDSAISKFIVVPPNFGNTVYAVTPSTYTCAAMTFSTGAGNSAINGPADPTNAGANSSFYAGGRVAYSAKEDALIFVGGPFQHAYALRLTPFAQSDFLNRCASPGVTLCQNFDTTAAFNNSLNYPNISPTVRNSSSGSGPTEIFQDTTTVASGTSSMRVDGPPQNGSFSDLSGGWYTWLGATQISYGPGGNGATDTHNDFWMQFRWRINGQLGNTDWESLVGSSPKHWDMYNVTAGSCSSEELTMIRQGNAGLNGFFDAYGGCGAWGYESFGGTSGSCTAVPANTGNQGQCWAPDGSVSPAYYESSNLAYNNGGNGCVYSSYAAPCDYEKNFVNEWLTVQVHIHFNGWDANPTIGSGTNYLDMWVAPIGQPLVLFKHFPNTAFFQQQGSGFKGFDTLLFENYMTSASCTGLCLTSWTTTASQWIDELLISSQQPPTPQQ
jgi:hypothetical protein